MKPAYSKSIAAALTGVVFFTNCLLVHAAETNLWIQRRESLKNSKLVPQNAPLLASLPAPVLHPIVPVVPRGILKNLPMDMKGRVGSLVQALPVSYGTIRKISSAAPSNSQRTIIHIQDIHRNAEAQENIGAAIQSLIDRNAVDLVALEGAFGPIDLSPFRTFPHQEPIRKVADLFLRDLKIAGPLHTALTSPRAIPPIVGVDDANHYEANVEAYRQSVRLMKPLSEKLSVDEKTLTVRKEKVFNKSLASFDASIQAYRSGSLKLGDYAQLLARQEVALSPAVEKFIEALKLETSLNFPAVEAERSKVLDQLLQALSKAQAAELVDASVAYRLGNVSPSEFYEYLRDLCAKSGVNLSRTPAMDAYIRYMLLADQIDAETLFSGMKSVEAAAYAALSQTADERALIEKSNQVHLIKKLLDFSLTNEEWGEYKSNIPPKDKLGPINNDLASFENFYREAEDRDHAMAKNLLKAMDEKNAKVAVLVTGGFHSQGMEEVFKRSGIATVGFTPKITKVDTVSGSAYLGVFAQEKTPLAKLFAGNKLFLAQLAFPPGMRAEAAFAAAREEVNINPRANFSKTATALLVGTGLTLFAGISIFGRNIFLAVLDNHQWAILVESAAGVITVMIPMIHLFLAKESLHKDHWGPAWSIPSESELQMAKETIQFLTENSDPSRYGYDFTYRFGRRYSNFKGISRTFRAIYYLYPDLAGVMIMSFSFGFHGAWADVLDGKYIEVEILGKILDRGLRLYKQGLEAAVKGEEFVGSLLTLKGVGGVLGYLPEKTAAGMLQEVGDDVLNIIVEELVAFTQSDRGISTELRDRTLTALKSISSERFQRGIEKYSPEIRNLLLRIGAVSLPKFSSPPRVDKDIPRVFGKAVGTLVIVNGSDPDFQELARIPKDSIVAMEFLPTSDRRIGPFNGIITFRQEDETSHAQIRARMWGIPHALMPGPDSFAHLEGKAVEFDVTRQGVAPLRAVDPQIHVEHSLGSNEIKSIRVNLPEVNLDDDSVFLAPGDPRLAKPEFVGHKVALLNQLAAHPILLSTPRIQLEFATGAAFPFGTFAHILKSRESGSLAELISALNSSSSSAPDNDEVESLSADIQSALRGKLENYHQDFPRIAMQIYPETEHLWKGVFIRASTNAEDLPDFPGFGAGIYKTVPNVKGKRTFYSAIEEVYASVWSEKAFWERQKYGVEQNTVHPAIWFVPSVEADYAFVIHTSAVSIEDPNQLVIEVVQGLGESLVGNDPEFAGFASRIVWDKSAKKIVSKSECRKEWQSVLAEAGGTIIKPVNPKAEFINNSDMEDLVLALGEVGEQSEAFFHGQPQDMEGVLKKGSDGKWTITLLQTRAIGKRTNGAGAQGDTDVAMTEQAPAKNSHLPVSFFKSQFTYIKYGQVYAVGKFNHSIKNYLAYFRDEMKKGDFPSNRYKFTHKEKIADFRTMFNKLTDNGKLPLSAPVEALYWSLLAAEFVEQPAQSITPDKLKEYFRSPVTTAIFVGMLSFSSKSKGEQQNFLATHEPADITAATWTMKILFRELRKTGAQISDELIQLENYFLIPADLTLTHLRLTLPAGPLRLLEEMVDDVKDEISLINISFGDPDLKDLMKVFNAALSENKKPVGLLIEIRKKFFPFVKGQQASASSAGDSNTTAGSAGSNLMHLFLSLKFKPGAWSYLTLIGVFLVEGLGLRALILNNGPPNIANISSGLTAVVVLFFIAHLAVRGVLFYQGKVSGRVVSLGALNDAVVVSLYFLFSSNLWIAIAIHILLDAAWLTAGLYPFIIKRLSNTAMTAPVIFGVAALASYSLLAADPRFMAVYALYLSSIVAVAWFFFEAQNRNRAFSSIFSVNPEGLGQIGQSAFSLAKPVLMTGGMDQEVGGEDEKVAARTEKFSALSARLSDLNAAKDSGDTVAEDEVAEIMSGFIKLAADFLKHRNITQLDTAYQAIKIAHGILTDPRYSAYPAVIANGQQIIPRWREVAFGLLNRDNPGDIEEATKALVIYHTLFTAPLYSTIPALMAEAHYIISAHHLLAGKLLDLHTPNGNRQASAAISTAYSVFNDHANTDKEVKEEAFFIITNHLMLVRNFLEKNNEENIEEASKALDIALTLFRDPRFENNKKDVKPNAQFIISRSNNLATAFLKRNMKQYIQTAAARIATAFEVFSAPQYQMYPQVISQADFISKAFNFLARRLIDGNIADDFDQARTAIDNSHTLFRTHLSHDFIVVADEDQSPVALGQRQKNDNVAQRASFILDLYLDLAEKSLRRITDRKQGEIATAALAGASDLIRGPWFKSSLNTIDQVDRFLSLEFKMAEALLNRNEDGDFKKAGSHLLAASDLLGATIARIIPGEKIPTVLRSKGPIIFSSIINLFQIYARQLAERHEFNPDPLIAAGTFLLGKFSEIKFEDRKKFNALFEQGPEEDSPVPPTPSAITDSGKDSEIDQQLAKMSEFIKLQKISENKRNKQQKLFLGNYSKNQVNNDFNAVLRYFKKHGARESQLAILYVLAAYFKVPPPNIKSRNPGASALWTTFHLNESLGLGGIGFIEGIGLNLAFLTMSARWMPQGPPNALTVLGLSFFIVLTLYAAVFLIHFVFGVLDRNNQPVRPDTWSGYFNPLYLSRVFFATNTAALSFGLFVFILPATRGTSGWIHLLLVVLGTLMGAGLHAYQNQANVLPMWIRILKDKALITKTAPSKTGANFVRALVLAASLILSSSAFGQQPIPLSPAVNAVEKHQNNNEVPATVNGSGIDSNTNSKTTPLQILKTIEASPEQEARLSKVRKIVGGLFAFIFLFPVFSALAKQWQRFSEKPKRNILFSIANVFGFILYASTVNIWVGMFSFQIFSMAYPGINVILISALIGIALKIFPGSRGDKDVIKNGMDVMTVVRRRAVGDYLLSKSLQLVDGFRHAEPKDVWQDGKVTERDSENKIKRSVLVNERLNWRAVIAYLTTRRPIGFTYDELNRDIDQQGSLGKHLKRLFWEVWSNYELHKRTSIYRNPFVNLYILGHSLAVTSAVIVAVPAVFSGHFLTMGRKTLSKGVFYFYRLASAMLLGFEIKATLPEPLVPEPWLSERAFKYPLSVVLACVSVVYAGMTFWLVPFFGYWITLGFAGLTYFVVWRTALILKSLIDRGNNNSSKNEPTNEPSTAGNFNENAAGSNEEANVAAFPESLGVSTLFRSGRWYRRSMMHETALKKQVEDGMGSFEFLHNQERKMFDPGTWHPENTLRLAALYEEIVVRLPRVEFMGVFLFAFDLFAVELFNPAINFFFHNLIFMLSFLLFKLRDAAFFSKLSATVFHPKIFIGNAQKPKDIAFFESKNKLFSERQELYGIAMRLAGISFLPNAVAIGLSFYPGMDLPLLAGVYAGIMLMTYVVMGILHGQWNLQNRKEGRALNVSTSYDNFYNGPFKNSYGRFFTAMTQFEMNHSALEGGDSRRIEKVKGLYDQQILNYVNQIRNTETQQEQALNLAVLIITAKYPFLLSARREPVIPFSENSLLSQAEAHFVSQNTDAYILPLLLVPSDTELLEGVRLKNFQKAYDAFMTSLVAKFPDPREKAATFPTDTNLFRFTPITRLWPGNNEKSFGTIPSSLLKNTEIELAIRLMGYDRVRFVWEPDAARPNVLLRRFKEFDPKLAPTFEIPEGMNQYTWTEKLTQETASAVVLLLLRVKKILPIHSVSLGFEKIELIRFLQKYDFSNTLQYETDAFVERLVQRKNALKAYHSVPPLEFLEDALIVESLSDVRIASYFSAVYGPYFDEPHFRELLEHIENIFFDLLHDAPVYLPEPALWWEHPEFFERATAIFRVLYRRPTLATDSLTSEKKSANSGLNLVWNVLDESLGRRFEEAVVRLKDVPMINNFVKSKGQISIEVDSTATEVHHEWNRSFNLLIVTLPPSEAESVDQIVDHVNFVVSSAIGTAAEHGTEGATRPLEISTLLPTANWYKKALAREVKIRDTLQSDESYRTVHLQTRRWYNPNTWTPNAVAYLAGMVEDGPIIRFGVFSVLPFLLVLSWAYWSEVAIGHVQGMAAFNVAALLLSVKILTTFFWSRYFSTHFHPRIFFGTNPASVSVPFYEGNGEGFFPEIHRDRKPLLDSAVLLSLIDMIPNLLWFIWAYNFSNTIEISFSLLLLVQFATAIITGHEHGRDNLEIRKSKEKKPLGISGAPASTRSSEALGDALLASAQYISGHKTTVPVDALWNVVNSNIGEVFKSKPVSVAMSGEELGEVIDHLQIKLAGLKIETDDAHQLAEILSRWVGRPVNVPKVGLEIIYQEKYKADVHRLLAEWPVERKIDLLVDKDPTPELKDEFKNRVNFTVLKGLFDAKGQVSATILGEYVTGPRSASLLAFSRDLMPGLVIDRHSPLYTIDFKPLEDLLAEFASDMPTVKVLPLGAVLELIRVLALQA